MAGAVFNTAEAAGKKKKDKKNDKAKVEAVELKNAADSLSYSAGMVRTEGLVNYLEQSLTSIPLTWTILSRAITMPWQRASARVTRLILQDSR